MCRGGRMFAPTQVWRKWHRKTNQAVRRYATCSALAASASTSLVTARGHAINNLKEIPLVVPNDVESIKKTKEAISVLKAVGAYDDIERVKASRKIRVGKGKQRNRRYRQARGPLVVYNTDNGITQAFRGLPGVDLCQVTRLNLLDLAPGGHLGRLIVWTEGAINRLNEIWGTLSTESELKSGWTLPRSVMSNADVARIINSEEVSAVLRPRQANKSTGPRRKVNPLTNKNAMGALNPYEKTRKKLAQRSVSKKQISADMRKRLNQRKRDHYKNVLKVD